MNKNTFFIILFVLSLAFVFIKIYQHNLIIKLTYQKQYIQNKKQKLKKQKNKMLVKYLKLKNKKKVAQYAQEKLGMQPLKLSQVITITHNI